MPSDVAIPPSFESTGLRVVYLADGSRLKGLLALQLLGELTAEELAATNTLPQRIGIRMGRTITIEAGTELLITTDAAQQLVAFAADGSGDPLIGFFGHSPVLRPVVSIAGGVAALRTALVSLGLITTTA